MAEPRIQDHANKGGGTHHNRMSAGTVSTFAKEEQQPYVPLSPHTKQVRRQERIAKGFIWLAAGCTLVVLVLIVGYIIVNGLYTRSVNIDPVLPVREEHIPFDTDDDGGFSIIAHSTLRLKEITDDQLREIYSGDADFWGYITGQNRDVSPMVYGDTAFLTAVERTVLGEEKAFPETIKRDITKDRLVSAVKHDAGAVALVPSDWIDDIRRVRIVNYLRFSVVAHPDIFELQAGRRLNRLTFAQVRRMMSGDITAWSEVGGPSIEITPADVSRGIEGEYKPLSMVPVVLRDGTEYQHHVVDSVVGTLSPAKNAVYVNSLTAFTKTINETEGAFGIIQRKEALLRDLPAIEIERTSHSLNLRPSFFYEPPSRAGAVGGVSYIIINTIAMVLFVLLIATPLGVAAAVYLVEYAKQGRLLHILRIGTDTLAGIPSIIFGLFGLVVFAQFFGFKTGLVSGTLTLTLMILPTIVRTSEEALLSVPDELRQGSMALGVTKLQTIVHVIIPAASPGILTGVILGIGRAVGETAAILFTMGSNLALIRSFNSPIRVLSVHLYMLIRENISLPNAFATATILVIIVFIVNYVTRRLISRMNRIHV